MATKQKKVLIVEDDKFIAEIYVAKFFAEGFKVSLAQNGKEGLEKANKEKPDVVLLDLLMPVVDGIETLKQIRSQKESKNTLVIVLTNANEKEQITKALKFGADDYLIKAQHTPDEVVEKIKKQISNNE